MAPNCKYDDANYPVCADIPLTWDWIMVNAESMFITFSHNSTDTMDSRLPIVPTILHHRLSYINI